MSEALQISEVEEVPVRIGRVLGRPLIPQPNGSALAPPVVKGEKRRYRKRGEIPVTPEEALAKLRKAFRDSKTPKDVIASLKALQEFEKGLRPSESGGSASEVSAEGLVDG